LGNCDNVLSRIVSLHIEGNALMEWSEVNKLGSLKNLTHLNVSGCQLTSIDLPCQSGNVSHLFPRLNHLLVSENDILNWTSLSELDKLASLQDLRCLKNPFLNTENPETNHQLIVARIQRLQVSIGIWGLHLIRGNLNLNLILQAPQLCSSIIASFGLEFVRCRFNAPN